MRHLVVLALMLPVLVHAQSPISLVPSEVAAFVGEASQGPVGTATTITSLAAFDVVYGTSAVGLANPHLRPSVAAFFTNGGSSLVVVRTDGTEAGTLAAIDALGDVDEVSMVAAPGETSITVQQALIDHCEALRDRMAILDAAPGLDASAVLTQRAALGTVDGFATLYAPWVWGTVNGTSTLLPPSGFVAGIWARTSPDVSPVAQVLGVTDVERDFTTAEVDQLVPSGINPLRFFSGQGVRVWGARTLATDPEWIYVAVRRQVHVLEESMYEGTTWVLDEPNDETTWNALRTQIDVFLDGLWRQGWFTGTTPDEAWFVRCDVTTMTASDIDQGRTIALVGVAPLRPAEFVILRVEQDRRAATAAPALREGTRLYAVPNPFNPRTALRFELPRPSSVHLDVFDVRGRLVVRLLEPTVLGSGIHSLLWDGRDRDGVRAGSGTYLVRLRVGSEVHGTRVTLVE